MKTTIRTLLQDAKPARTYAKPGEKLCLLAVHAATLVDAAVFVLTLGRYESHLRSAVLFSPWADSFN